MKSYTSYEVVADQAEWLSTSSLRELFANQCFCWSGGAGARVKAHVLQTKAIGRAVVMVREKD